MRYYKSPSRFSPLQWVKEMGEEEDAFIEEERLQETYPDAESIDAWQDEDHYPYLWHMHISFKNEADEAEFIMRESP